MTLLLAHHIEPHHLPVLAGMFAAGCWIGWEAIAKLSNWRQSRLARTMPSPDRS